MQQIAGHQNIITTLEYYFQKKHSHAFLFAGVESLGKTLVSDWFIEKIFSVDNLHEVKIENVLDVKIELDKLIISLEQVVRLQQQIFLKPFNNLPLIVRIFGPEFFSAEAANRLLKILEEPPMYVIFILITNNEQLVLPTIKSRCEIMHFGRVDDGKIRDYLLNTQGSLPSNIEQIISLADGRPGLVKRFLEDSDYLESYLNDLNKILTFLTGDVVAQLAILQDWFNNKKSYNERKKQMEYMLSLLQELLHAIILTKGGKKVLLLPGLNDTAKQFSQKQILYCLENLFKNQQKLVYNPDIQTMANSLIYN